MNSFFTFFYNIADWITKFFLLNVYWLFFTLIGGIILGFFPSTLAMFSIVRQWIKGNTDIKLFNTFLKYFRNDFIKGNLLGLFIMTIIIIIIFDFSYILKNINELPNWLIIPFFSFNILFLLFLLYIFPTYVHFEIKLRQVIKNALLIMLISPVNSFLIIISLSSIFIIFYFFPPVAFIFGGSTCAFIIMYFSNHSFKKINKKTYN